MPDGPESRREALRRIAGWSLAAAGALPLEGCAARSRGVRVAALAELAPGTAVRTRYRDLPVIVVNDGGTVRVLSGLCTHESCELGWNATQRLIRCPCHGSAFEPDGRVRLGPATEPLPELPSRVIGGAVHVTGPPAAPAPPGHGT